MPVLQTKKKRLRVKFCCLGNSEIDKKKLNRYSFKSFLGLIGKLRRKSKSGVLIHNAAFGNLSGKKKKKKPDMKIKALSRSE